MKELRKTLDYEIFKYFEEKIEKADIKREEQDILYEALNNRIDDVIELVEDLEREFDSDIEKFEGEYEDYKDYLWAKYHVVL